MSKRKVKDAHLPVGECITKVFYQFDLLSFNWHDHLCYRLICYCLYSSLFSASGHFKGEDLLPAAPCEAGGGGGTAQVGLFHQIYYFQLVFFL